MKIEKLWIIGLLMVLTINVAFAQNTTTSTTTVPSDCGPLSESECISRSDCSPCYSGTAYRDCCNSDEECVKIVGDAWCELSAETSTTTTSTTTSSTTIPPNSCTDSDGGIKPLVKGTASGYYNGQSYSKTDFCNTTTYLTEYYCSGTNWRVWYYNCKNYGSSYICSGGRCYYGGGGCPTLFIYDGNDYIKERKSNIHSQRGIDTVDDITLTTKPAIVDGMYLLSLKETTLPEHSYIDSVKLFVDGSEAELVSAVHSKYGDVTSILEKSDDIRTDTKLFDKIELKFKVPEVKEANSFYFEIEGYNPADRITGQMFYKMDIADVGLIVAVIAIVILVIIFFAFKLYAKKI